LVLTLNAAGLQPGQYTGQVRVDGASGTLNSPQNIAVALTVTAPTQPQLVVSPSAVSMTLQSGQSATRTVQVTNTGVGTLNWAASLVSGAPWLSFSPASGTAPSPLVLALNAAGLQPGQYTGQVRVDGGSGTLNSPQDVTVTLTVIAPTQPQLVVSPSAVSMTLQSGQSATRTVQVTNTGAGTLNWTATLVSGAPWLSFSPASGTAPSSLILTLNAAGLQPGQYSGLVRVDGGSGTLGSPQDITVTITVTEPPLPQLSVTPTAITLSLEQGQTTTRDVQIANTGAGTLDWTAALVQGAPWLSFSPTSGQAPSTLVLSISAVGVDPGQYVGKVQITGGGGALNSPQDVTVNLTVTPAPFYATPTSVAWTYIPPTNPGTRTVTVTGVGISWHAGVVPMDQMQRIQAAIDAGLPMSINNGILVINDGGEDVPIVDYIDVNPSSSGANQTGVLLNLVLDRVPYGFSQVAVVFVADGVAMPPAVVVRATVLRTLPNATDLFFLPMIVNGQP
jgi:hypothetical protein